MFDVKIFCMACAFVLILTVIFTALAVFYVNQQRQAACHYVCELEDKFRQLEQYQPLSLLLVKETIKELFHVPWQYFQEETGAAKFWQDEYVRLMELFLAVSIDDVMNTRLVYGAFHETTKHRYDAPFKMLIWMEFAYKGRTWAIWVDPEVTSKGKLGLRIDRYDDFNSFGNCFTQDYSSGGEVRKLLKRCYCSTMDDEQE